MTLPIRHIIDSGIAGPHLLITAGVHGDELEPVVAASQLAAKIKPLIRRGKVTIVPVTNESAYGAGNRTGSDGKDLARVCPGNAVGSVTERAAYVVSELIRTADYYIDLHTGGKLFEILPLAGYMLHPSGDVLEKQRSMAKAFNLSLIWGTEASPEGRTLSVARDVNVPAIYVEYGGGCAFNALAVEAIQNGCINVMRKLGIVPDYPVPPDGLKYLVEDAEIGSGHLQVKMPAPADGIFVPNVTLGAGVSGGDCWGIIYDPAGNKETEVIADRSGIAFFIRCYPRVNKGESLGGILVQ